MINVNAATLTLTKSPDLTEILTSNTPPREAARSAISVSVVNAGAGSFNVVSVANVSGYRPMGAAGRSLRIAVGDRPSRRPGNANVTTCGAMSAARSSSPGGLRIGGSGFASAAIWYQAGDRRRGQYGVAACCVSDVVATRRAQHWLEQTQVPATTRRYYRPDHYSSSMTTLAPLNAIRRTQMKHPGNSPVASALTLAVDGVRKPVANAHFQQTAWVPQRSEER